jgi:hypothetical protein
MTASFLTRTLAVLGLALNAGCRERPSRERPPEGSSVAADPCSQLPECAGYGWCTMVAASCRPTLPSHCQDSAECRGFGRCTLASDGAGAHAMSLRPPTAGWCVAAKDADCQASDDCRSEGRCDLDPEARLCRAGSRMACERATACRMRGACELVAGQCAATTERHCLLSSGCSAHGKCGLLGGTCVGGVTAKQDATSVH